jgi:hypothetical protein
MAARTMLADSMDDFSLADVSKRTWFVIAFCAMAVFVVCVALLVMLWPI